MRARRMENHKSQLARDYTQSGLNGQSCWRGAPRQLCRLRPFGLQPVVPTTSAARAVGRGHAQRTRDGVRGTREADH